MTKRLLFLLTVLLSGMATMWAQNEATYSPTLDVNFRTAAGNTAWNSGFPKSAAEEGNKDFELTSTAGLFALQKYTVEDLQNASKLVLTLTVGSKSGVDAVKLWSIPVTNWDASSGIDDIYPAVQTALGVDLRSTEGTPNSPLVNGAKVAESNPAKATFTITGTALATIKANAASDGTFTLLLTNNNLIDSNNKRSYLSNNSANDEANRPSLVATIEKPSVINTTTGVGYSTLEEAFAAARTAGTDAVLEVSADQKLTARQTWDVAASISIIPTADITIKGPKNAMWFLANKNDGTMIIGSKDYKITFDGINDDRSTFGNNYVTRRENTTKLYLTNIEFKDFVCGDYALVGCKNNGGGIFLEDIAFNNCSTTGNGLVENLREANDALYLKGFMNVGTDCTGTTIYTAKNRIRMGEPEGTTMYSDFTATNTITIGTADANYVEGTLLIVKVGGAYADMFKPAKDGWYFARTTTNGDMKLTQTAPTGIQDVRSQREEVNGEYFNLGGQRVAKPTKGLYIVNGKKIMMK